MLVKKDLFEGMGKKYTPMLKMVSIPDFTKCIAQFSGLHIKDVKDEVIKEYLQTWAKNKYRFFELLGNKLQYDTTITYKEENKDVSIEMTKIMKDYPAYALWLDSFKYVDNNKIENRDLTYNTREVVNDLFNGFHIDGCSVTHFFKSKLNAPDELVTAIGRIWENAEVTGNYTISIDPVDMMLASENPYNWKSCYRLSVDDDYCSHADGCLAAILDDSSLITYVWNKEGKFSLYGEYQFKNVRWKQMREWISISPSMNAIHFNDIYPGKDYSNDFHKILRKVCEDLVNKDAIWVHNENWQTHCLRKFLYGYSEYSDYKIWKIKDSQVEYWQVFNEKIICPCGCGCYLPGSDNDDDDGGYDYSGEGFIAENFYEKGEKEWCDYIDDYCERDSDCECCSIWNRYNPVCELNINETCENSKEARIFEEFNPYKNNIVHCGEHCEGCPLYKIHHLKPKEENATHIAVIESIKSDGTIVVSESNASISIPINTDYSNDNNLTNNVAIENNLESH